ncbi:MAG: carbohydrate kinase family protein [Haloplanus sp.]
MGVVCAGHVNWDHTFLVDRLPDPDCEARVETRVAGGGGGAANVSRGLVGLGVSATVLGAVGDDERGDTAVAGLSTAGVQTDHVRRVTGTPTTEKYLVVGDAGEVVVLGCAGANESFAADDLPPETLAASGYLHLTGQRPATAAELAGRARAAGATVSFDPGRRLGDRDFSATLDLTDLLFVTDREAAWVPDDWLTAGRTLVVKRGADGADVRTPATTRTHPGFAVDPRDTTGAGDAFAAGYLAARRDGADEDRALAVANACGAVATQVVGSRAPLDWEAVRTLLEEE